jgi:hypothetical protein
MDSTAFVPVFRKLYLCRYGHRGGQQIALFLGYRGDGYVVRKWRANLGRWTQDCDIRKSDLLAKATAQDCRRFAVDVSKL